MERARLAVESFWLGVSAFQPLNVTKSAVRRGSGFQANALRACVCVCATSERFLPESHTRLARFVTCTSTEYFGLFPLEQLCSYVIPFSQGRARMFCKGPKSKRWWLREPCGPCGSWSALPWPREAAGDNMHMREHGPCPVRLHLPKGAAVRTGPSYFI